MAPQAASRAIAAKPRRWYDGPASNAASDLVVPAHRRWPSSAEPSPTCTSSARSRRRTSRRTKSTSSSGRSAPKASRACRTGSGWCCRASSPNICPAPGGYAVARHPVEGRPRDADRPLEGHGRVPARRHQLRDVPHRELPRQAGRCARRSSPAAAVAPDRAAAVPPLPVRRRASDPRFTPTPSWRRSRRTRGCRSSTGCCTGSRSSRARGGRCCGCGERGRLDAAAAGLGPRPHRSVQPGEVHDAAAADRRHHRQLRHGAAVEPEARRDGYVATTGTA